MPAIESKFFGLMTFEAPDLFRFPLGIPGFEREKEFVAVEIPSQGPVMYLQSVTSPDLCFITLPVRACLHDYQLELSPAERQLLALDPVAPLRLGCEVGCFAIVTVDPDGEPVANLAAPLVMNLANRNCIQSFQADFDYSFRHVLTASEEVATTC
jgi:flagellar assembly factor FliW